MHLDLFIGIFIIYIIFTFIALIYLYRDIKCDNILLHSPPGSGRVHAKISDFGFAKKVDLNNKQTYLAGFD
jgi:serine/threonine protein kinase